MDPQGAVFPTRPPGFFYISFSLGSSSSHDGCLTPCRKDTHHLHPPPSILSRTTWRRSATATARTS